MEHYIGAEKSNLHHSRDHRHCRSLRNKTVVITNDEYVKSSILAILVIKLLMEEGDDLNKYRT